MTHYSTKKGRNNFSKHITPSLQLEIICKGGADSIWQGRPKLI